MQSILKSLKGDDPARKGRSIRDSLKWVAFIVSFICFTAGRFGIFMRVIYDAGSDPPSRTPTAETLSMFSATILTVTFLLSLILGALTVPRWQGFLALAVVGWAIWMRLVF